jgi:hypothetical protein
MVAVVIGNIRAPKNDEPYFVTNVNQADDGVPPLVVQVGPNAYGTAQEWRDSAGELLAFLSSEDGFWANFVGGQSGQFGYLSGSTFAADSADVVGTVRSARSETFGTSSIAVQSVVRGAPGQSADMAQWQSSSGAVRANVDANGQINSGGGMTTAHWNAAATPLIVKAAATQTAPMQAWTTNTGVVLTMVDSVGGFQVNESLAVGNAKIPNVRSAFYAVSAGVTPIVVRTAANQTAPMQQWQNSAAVAVVTIPAGGGMNFIRGATATSSASSNSPVVTFQSSGWNGTTSVESISYMGNARQGGGGVGARFFIGDSANPDLSALAISMDGTRTVSVGSGFAESVGQLVVYSTLATRNTQVNIGVAAQTADLQQWRNSSGTALARQSIDGTFTTIGNIVAGGPTVGGDGLTVNGNASGFTKAVLRNSTSTGNTLLEMGSTAAGTYDRLWQIAIGGGNVNGTGNGSGQNEGTFTFQEAGTARARIDRGGLFNMLFGSLTTSPSVSAVADIVKGAASQTASLSEWRNSSNVVLASIGAAGQLTTSSMTMTTANGFSLPSGTPIRWGSDVVRLSGDATSKIVYADSYEMVWRDTNNGYAAAAQINGNGFSVFGNRTIRSGVCTTATRPNPSFVGAGARIYDSTISKPLWSDGTIWRDADAVAA